MHIAKITEKAHLEQGVTASVNGAILTVKGPKGELSRALATKKVHIAVEGSEIIFTALNATKNDKCIMMTHVAHARNMAKGAHHGYVYKLKICSGHFPMSVALKGDTLEVKNFIGEAVPRRLKLIPGAKVTVTGSDITVEATSKELAGTQAAAIELMTRRPGFDTRVFQDGIYITEKAGKKV